MKSTAHTIYISTSSTCTKLTTKSSSLTNKNSKQENDAIAAEITFCFHTVFPDSSDSTLSKNIVVAEHKCPRIEKNHIKRITK